MTATQYYAQGIGDRVGVPPALVVPVVLALINAWLACDAEPDPEVVARKLANPNWRLRRRMRRAIRYHARERGLIAHETALVADVMAECEDLNGPAIAALIAEAKMVGQDTEDFE